MNITCGIFLMTEDGRLLACHPTNSPTNVLSIPKGLPDDGENYWKAAQRELKEETGIEVLNNHYPIPLLPIGYYNKNKTLISYIVQVENDMIHKELKCSSYTSSGEIEVDKFYWLNPDEYDMIQTEQYEILLKSLENININKGDGNGK